MMKIQHKQSEEIRDISRHTWENTKEYQDLKHLWIILEEGDPVYVIWIEENDEQTNLGLFDRDHAIRMIKMNSRQCYYKEIDRIGPTVENTMTESEWIDKVLKDAKQGDVVLIRATPDEYQDAVERAVEEGLITPKPAYRLTKAGREVLKAEGYDKWQAIIEKEKKDALNRKSNTINFHGPVANPILNQDSFLRDLSITQSAHPAPNEKEKQQNAKSSRTLKVIGGLAIGVIIGLIVLYIEYKSGYFMKK